MPKVNMNLVFATAFGLIGLCSRPAQAATAPDAWITTKIKIDMIRTSHIDSNDVHVDTIDGKVTLHGTVDTPAERKKAEAVAKGIKGVTSVRNLLQVVPKKQQEAVEQSDDTIKKKVDALLRADPSLSDSSIEVKSVNKGTVLLAGKAQNMFDYLRALESTESIPGVRGVASEITSTDTLPDVDKTKSKSAAKDAWITTETKMRLLADPDAPALDINVDTHDGVVTLFGMVPTEAAKASAVDDAKKVDAAVSVNDALQVVPKAEQKRIQVTDSRLQKNIESAFKKHSEFRDLSVQVENGVAHLTGNVSSGWQRVQAATIARGTKGVASVQDDIHIEQPRG